MDILYMSFYYGKIGLGSNPCLLDVFGLDPQRCSQKGKENMLQIPLGGNT